jgi:hypothetical protein
MSRHRQGELGSVPLRSGRFFYIDSKWYFACREGKNRGPYDSRQAAQLALEAYIRELEGPAANRPDEAEPPGSPLPAT